MVLFSPWAFGTTEPWSIWTINCAGYCLGALLLLKLAIRSLHAYRPPRWTDQARIQSSSSSSSNRIRRYRRRHFLTAQTVTNALAGLTVLLLLYCLTSALNARASFDERSLTFTYYDYVSWLPHTLDRAATWFAFWTYLGLAGAFWGVRDWLLGKSGYEQRPGAPANTLHPSAPSLADKPGAPALSPANPPFPARLRRLIWVLAINGALVALEAIVQRAAGSPRLLFLVLPRIHQTADSQFGPYAYRSNAAQYFNLLWPVCVGLWWTLNRNACTRSRTHHLLLVAAAMMAAGAIMSTSRAGAIVALAIAVAAALVFAAGAVLWSSTRENRHEQRRVTLRALTWFFSGSVLAGLSLGWNALGPRLAQLNDGLQGREQMYDVARPIAADYPWFGTGPGSFETVSQLYPRPEIFWPTQLHNDWLETRITFGWVGSAFIALAFACVLVRWAAAGGIHGGRRFVILAWLALAGCLLHARFDFPFQIHSTLLLFLLLCAVLSTLSRRAVAG